MNEGGYFSNLRGSLFWGRKDVTVDDLRLVTVKVKDETIVQTGARVKPEQDKTPENAFSKNK